jgi:hypothetical protein
MNGYKVVAEWKGRGKKQWLKLLQNEEHGFLSFRAENGGGSMGEKNVEQAIEYLEKQIIPYWFPTGIKRIA